MDTMKPIKRGHRGSAVEDIQRRLLSLGYDLGPTGVDGAFLDHTIAAVRDFQITQDLEPTDWVNEATWRALVNATFTLGDRNLLLRRPYLHGRDVLQLQQALIVLGFTPGACDGIFGPFTSDAVREFQENAGVPADGMVGDNTSAALDRLRHVWEGKEPVAHSAADALMRARRNA